MQLWKKNFLVTFFLFLIVIYLSLMFFHIFIFQSDLRQWMSRAVSREQGLQYVLNSYQDTGDRGLESHIEYTAREFITTGQRVRVEIDGKTIANYIPDSIIGDKSLQIAAYQDVPYVLIIDGSEIEEHKIRLSYMESMASFHHNQKQKVWFIQILGILLSAIIGGMLYLTMKRINRPVSQIAHELRTPLTGIYGYAQYLMMGNISEEDSFFAAQQIVESSRNLGSIVENLLIMGGVREGAVQMKRIDLKALLSELKAVYLGIDLEGDAVYVQGDRTLVKCMMENLIQNAVKAGCQTKISFDSHRITVWNDGEPIEEKKLKRMNRPQGITSEYADSHGFGIGLCHEIAGMHGWKLSYRSARGEGTTAQIRM